MKDRTILNVLTLLGLGTTIFVLLRRKGDSKDWFLIFFIKTLVSTLIDGPVIKKKFVKYPIRYFPKLFDSNITFLYVLFPLACVVYNQFTYKMKPLLSILSVFLFSAPITLLEDWLERHTNLVEYHKGWNSLYTFSVLTMTFWLVKSGIGLIRILDMKINPSSLSDARSRIE
ncbi:hypothetical protein BpOF4_09995 [Alkalihalophilus pseudofirmus OF4]|uniref:Uncharacterized protein n=1 Tax=Alkalihalophilus pseudofirmus (strain ATCC BAA-2126 / JCM 17055 / OF4) TaxID=398511 RepID=D3FTI1_ALKPO|nr:CBO0543 family protein [Alkalihalophilus pseudofirmus]ADC50054.1 hypothetical protein BpOF4_09995 [Alkalihalophilus pseudofirmus OF4]